MTDIRVGDKVQVTKVGVVEDVDGDGGLYIERAYYQPGRHGDVTVLERAKPKVGDIVNTREEYAALPTGTVCRIVSPYPMPTYVKLGTGEFACINNGNRYDFARVPLMPREIVYLP